MNKIKQIISTLACVSFALLLSGCQLIILNPKGMIGAQEKNIMIISALLMLLIVVPVIVLTLLFAWRYRASNNKATYSPEWSHSTTLEIIWWTIPCIIIAILGVITWTSSHQLDPYRPIEGNENKAITIQAIALEWKWLFVYPEQNIASVNYLQFPVNVPINFLITAEGPMNSFQIPQLGGQIYAMAGMQSKLHLISDTIGDYRGMSSNFSGKGFSEMKFSAHVSSQKDFNQWVKSIRQSTKPLTLSMYNRLLQPSENNTIEYFSSSEKDLFQTVMMKTMMPMQVDKETVI